MHPHLWNPEAGAVTDLAVPAAPVPAGRVDPVTTAPVAQADREDLECTDLAVREVRVGPVTTVRVDRVDLDSTARVGRVAPALGMAMTIAAISTGLRGATDQHPGVSANRRDPHGTARCRLLARGGTTGRSTTGVTRRLRSGTRSSTSSDSTSSEFGSRCKNSPLKTPASPIGGAGVALSPVGELSAE